MSTWRGKPLEYKAEYRILVSPLPDSDQSRGADGGGTGDIGLGFSSHGGALAEWVDPTTVEEYRILLMIGDKLGEQGMPPCNYRGDEVGRISSAALTVSRTANLPRFRHS